MIHILSREQAGRERTGHYKVDATLTHCQDTVEQRARVTRLGDVRINPVRKDHKRRIRGQ